VAGPSGGLHWQLPRLDLVQVRAGDPGAEVEINAVAHIGAGQG